MLTAAQKKLIKSLNDKKSRNETGLFLVEGRNSTTELLDSDFEIELLCITKDFFSEYKEKIKNKGVQYEIVDENSLSKLGALETNNSSIAVVKQKSNPSIDISKEEIVIALDTIQNPANLGSIIRIADWYGIKNIIASKNTVDFYNPKTIFTSKGSFLRINVHYIDLKDFFSKNNIKIFGAYLEGSDVHKTDFSKGGIILMGNESKGISKDLEKFVTEKITIPRYGKAESLNVAIATAVILDNVKNRHIV